MEVTTEFFMLLLNLIKMEKFEHNHLLLTWFIYSKHFKVCKYLNTINNKTSFTSFLDVDHINTYLLS